MTLPPPTDPMTAFFALGQIKLGETDLGGVLTRVADLAVETLSGAAEVSVTLLPGDAPYTAAATGDLALELDAWQYARGEGPTLQAAAARTTVSIADTGRESRWPEWARQALTRGARSGLFIGLPIQEQVTGALNVYSTRAAAFDEATFRLAETFAGYAAVAIGNAHLYDTTARRAEHMRSAMASRAVIEQAKGIIMGERRCTADEAFAVLTKASQDSNRKVRDIAAALVARAQRTPRR